jgi:pimeloyl-ACP methyl ester carboxylesterase
MTQLRADPAFLAGDTEADAEYFRLHYRPTFRRPDQLEQTVRRLRAGFTPQGIVAAAAIEQALFAQTWALPDYDLVPALRTLTIPTLVLRGEDDFIPAETARRIANAIPGARFAEIADSGHFSYIEQPELVCSAIAAFIGSP